MNGGGGYARVHRALIGHPALRNEGEVALFMWLIVKASWQPTRVRYKGRPITLQRGQLAISIRDLANAHERSQSWIWRFLERVKSETMIETHAETGVNVITICNYSIYQASLEMAETGRETAGETQPKQRRNTEQRKEESNEDSPPTPPRGSAQTFLPVDWKPPPIADLTTKARQCAEQWPADAYERIAEGFALYWQSRNRKMVDWFKTWCGWILREHWKVMQEARRQNGGRGEPQSMTEYLKEHSA